MTQPPPVNSAWEEKVFTYWDNKRTDRLNLMPEIDAYVHSHFAVTDFDGTVLDTAPDKREDAVLAELHRIENEQVGRFLDILGDLPANAVLLDSGCGRGGTSIMAHERFGCRVEGVDFSPYRLDCARQAAAGRGCADAVTFHLGNMTATGRLEHAYDAVVINEAAEHVDDNDGVCAEAARLLKPGGLFAIATWLAHDDAGQASEEVAAIDRHYRTRIYTRKNLIRAMVAHHLIPRQIHDLTRQAIPYWELRSASAHKTGVEEPFLAAYQSTPVKMNYLFLLADYQPSAS
ncbi:cyclopropane-fatty-acyl-phospholipid synthase family protein [Streptomyces sp. IMTB 2501]|uniref:SAM-dependent methyltransferase n=1 Tax=Streptomyces sp. IMTB 2501 TaxID=1776340 RepID=UPI0009A1E46B|nr:class I SAM-dependent methyltransferase [Streptomyces sp. IMTB 2501]